MAWCARSVVSCTSHARGAVWRVDRSHSPGEHSQNLHRRAPLRRSTRPLSLGARHEHAAGDTLLLTGRLELGHELAAAIAVNAPDCTSMRAINSPRKTLAAPAVARARTPTIARRETTSITVNCRRSIPGSERRCMVSSWSSSPGCLGWRLALGSRVAKGSGACSISSSRSASGRRSWSHPGQRSSEARPTGLPARPRASSQRRPRSSR